MKIKAQLTILLYLSKIITFIIVGTFNLVILTRGITKGTIYICKLYLCYRPSNNTVTRIQNKNDEEDSGYHTPLHLKGYKNQMRNRKMLYRHHTLEEATSEVQLMKITLKVL